MKTAIVAFNNIKFSPYVFPYVNYLKSIDADVDLIYADRGGFKEHIDGVNLRPTAWNGNVHKALNFISFRNTVKKILKSEEYDFVFVLTTFPAVLLSGYLASEYKDRYLVDIRDFTYESNKVYYRAECKALKNAAMRVISSSGFKCFLPDCEYTVCHNVVSEYSEGAKLFERGTGKRLTIGYVGTIAYAENCIKMIDIVRKDERLEFHFHGNENGCRVKEYIKSIGCDRIKYFGEYKPSEKGCIIESVDLLFNVYGNGRQLLERALSNKLYDSMYYKKPLLVSPKTDMHRETQPFSFAVDFGEGTADRLCDWYDNINGDEFNKFADNFLKKTFSENDVFKNRLDLTVKRWIK